MRRLTRASLSPPRTHHWAAAASALSSRSVCRKFAATPRRRSGSYERQWTTPLAKQLCEAITTTGPVPLASFMRMCLTGDVGGYYSGALLGREACGGGRDHFGAKGDFVTSPEISQVFGELVGLWLVSEWISQARPQCGVQLIEVGPGRGTLMDDMLRTISRFPPMAAAIDSVFLVEASPDLREAQKSLLCGLDAPCTESCVGRHSTGKRLGSPIVWTETIKSIPIEADKMPLIVAHEFFDALPIHTFQSAPSPSATSSTPDAAAAGAVNVSPPAMEWREMMVSQSPPFLFDTAAQPGAEHPAEFQLVLSSGTTRHSRYLPESSPRYRKLKQTPDSVIEICPDASLHAADFATRIGGSPKHPKPHPKGAALILDYGPLDTVPTNSLRGIRHHRLVSPFSSPGLVDLSADVDFTALAENATRASDGVEVHGPVPQADFLELMGIRERAKTLAESAEMGAVENIHKAWKRLVDRGPDGMGKVYKVLAILPENDGRRRPVGFGGDVRV